MKTRLLGLCCSLLTLALWAAPPTFTSFDHPLKLKTHQAADGGMVLQLINLQTKLTHVTLTYLDEKAVCYRTKVTDHNGFTTALVLDEAPDGRYLLEVIQDEVKLTQVIVKRKDRLLFSQITERT